MFACVEEGKFCTLGDGIEIGEQKYKPTHQFGDFFPISLTLSTFFATLFSDLASENTELLASLASVLNNLIPPHVSCLQGPESYMRS
jgi:hypothetical protein